MLSFLLQCWSLMLKSDGNADVFRPVGCKARSERVVVNEAGAKAGKTRADRQEHPLPGINFISDKSLVIYIRWELIFPLSISTAIIHIKFYPQWSSSPIRFLPNDLHSQPHWSVAGDGGREKDRSKHYQVKKICFKVFVYQSSKNLQRQIWNRKLSKKCNFSAKLIRRLSLRPTPEELEERNVLKSESKSTDKRFYICQRKWIFFIFVKQSESMSGRFPVSHLWDLVSITTGLILKKVPLEKKNQSTAVLSKETRPIVVKMGPPNK